MPIIRNFKDIINMPMWRMDANLLGANVSGAGIFNDRRNNLYRHPYIFVLRSNVLLDIYDPTTGATLPLASPALTGTFGPGARCVFHSSGGPRGVIAAGATVNSLTLTTALPAAVTVNQMANRGAGLGYIIRVIDNSVGGTGKVEERRIISNTAGTTPTVWFDAPLSFTPQTNSNYEILSGRLYIMGGSVAVAGTWKYYDVLTNSYSGNLSVVNLPATNTLDSGLLTFSEQLTPVDRAPGEGFVQGDTTWNGTVFNAIQATAANSTTITGSGMPATLFANEYSNFQVRIVSDPTNPTAAGQRRRIASHTAGANGVFTVSPSWTVTPSSAAKFVVEGNDDRIMFNPTGTATYCYNINANTWDTTTFAASPGVTAAGMMNEQAFGLKRDETGNARQSFIYSFRGGATNTLDVYDIATNTWSTNIPYGNQASTFTTGTSAAYANATEDGRFMYINVNGTQVMARFDMQNRLLDPSTTLRYTQGVALAGCKMATAVSLDTTDKVTFVYHFAHTQTVLFALAIQR